MFVRIHRNRLSIGIFGVHTYDFLGEKPRLRRAACSLLAAQRKCVLVLARDLKLLRNVLGGLGHGIDAILRLEQ